MKTNGNVTADRKRPGVSAFSTKKYGQLLAETVPGVISGRKEYDRLETIFDKLITRGEDNLSPEEFRLYELLGNLLEEYEARTLPPLPKTSPADALRFIMSENDLKQTDLTEIFGSQSAVSRALSGERRISVEQAKGLAQRFRVSVDLFL